MELGDANEERRRKEERENSLGDGRVNEHKDGTLARSARDMTGDSQGLRDLAEKLEGRGLSSRVVTYSGEKSGEELVEEVIVTNPAARERGEVRIGDDGAVTWEFFGDLGEAGAGRILDEATNALRATGVPFQRETRLSGDQGNHPASTQKPTS
jgi:hypothetical protein